MIPAQTVGRFKPTSDVVEYMEEHGLTWCYHTQRFAALGHDWCAHVGLCLDGRWLAGYSAVRDGNYRRLWESAKFDDLIACLLNAKLENWGN